jgi:hypothetical protein
VTLWVAEGVGVAVGRGVLGEEVGDGRWVAGVATGAALQPARTSAIATTVPLRRARRL